MQQKNGRDNPEAIQEAVEPLETMDVSKERIQKTQEGLTALKEFISGQLVENEDYGKIPGTPKPSLWKGGAEKLLALFSLSALPERTTNCIEDWENGFFHYEIRCPIIHRPSGKQVTIGWGSCNSKEVKYRYRWEGSGANRRRVENKEPWDSQNTILKMAVKRAVIDGTLRATRASFFFTQDVEDQKPAQPADRPSTGAKPVEPTAREAKQPEESREPQPVESGNQKREELRNELVGLLSHDAFTAERANPIIRQANSSNVTVAWLRLQIKRARDIIEKYKREHKEVKWHEV